MCIDYPFLLIAEWYSSVWVYYSFFIHSPDDGDLDYFQFMDITYKTAVNIHVQVIYQYGPGVVFVG